ncbi:hypothetical protein BH11BAC4_BH11BAC4_14370 [soil metagenome]
MTYFKNLLSCCIALMVFSFSQAQQKDPASEFYEQLKKINPDSSAVVRVINITIRGNKKTKSYIILREVPFRSGDSMAISTLPTILEQTRRQVFNTSLFSEVFITPALRSATEIDVVITVLEKWYIFPTPQFQFADRNINEWLKTYHADFNRVIYGVKFTHYNFSGRGDQLRIYLLNGYSRAISFAYSLPASNSKLSEGFSVYGGYSQNREVIYKTSKSNKLLQYKQNDFVRNNWSLSASYQSRKGFFSRNFYTFTYTYTHVDDSVLAFKYNPNYFGKPGSSVGIPDLSYTYQYANIDHVNYPLTGTTGGFSILKRGLGWNGGINMLSLEGAYVKYRSYFKNRLYSSFQLYSKVKLPFQLAYINQRGLGYGELYLRGQEYYVVDGVASMVAKLTLKKKVISFKIPTQFLRIRQLPNIPFTFFAKVYGDVGYSYAEREFESRLNNRLLYSGGFGIDILSVYGFTLNLEYSFNQFGENGLFLHGKSGF